MSTKQPTVNKISTPKKTLLAEVVLQISKAMPTLKALLGEKKFEKRIKKAFKNRCYLHFNLKSRWKKDIKC